MILFEFEKTPGVPHWNTGTAHEAEAAPSVFAPPLEQPLCGCSLKRRPPSETHGWIKKSDTKKCRDTKSENLRFYTSKGWRVYEGPSHWGMLTELNCLVSGCVQTRCTAHLIDGAPSQHMATIALPFCQFPLFSSNFSSISLTKVMPQQLAASWADSFRFRLSVWLQKSSLLPLVTDLGDRFGDRFHC